MTITRRTFLGTTLAAAATPAFAQTAAVIDPLAPRRLKLSTAIPAGEIHVDPSAFALYWTLPGNEAIRYAVGVGRPGLYERGVFRVGAKKEWPDWTPTPEMIERNPAEYKQYEDGMPGGVDNPLGARALYLFEPGRGDTFLRIHGTNAPRTIGSRVSNGCVRLENRYVEELYELVPVGTRVVLY